MSSASSAADDADHVDARADLLGVAADRFTEELQNGGRPRLEDYLEEYPEIAESIVRLFPTLIALHTNSSTDPHATDAELPMDLGDYRLLEEIGRGGMGVVYRAEQRSLGRIVALKTLPWAATLSDTHLARFRNEARAAASLSHEHIVPVYSVGYDRGVNYYVMQWIVGRSVAECIDEVRKSNERLQSDLHVRQVARLTAQAARALDHAHSLGVVHRDIKPGNLLVSYSEQTSDGGDSKLWVTDFGLAQIEGDVRLSHTGDLLGTIRYMSPEQTKGHTSVVDHRTDIYSLGATLFEWLAGRPAFIGDDRMTVLRQIEQEDPPRLGRVARHVPHDLETIVAKAMEKSPVDRYRTAAELADDLENFLHSRPLLAQPSSGWQRARKWARRHQTTVWTAGLALSVTTVLLAISTLLITIAYRGTDQQRQRAETHLRLARELIDNTYLKEARRVERDPASLGEQRDVLERLIHFYRELPAEDRGHPAFLLDKALVQQRLGDLYRSMGQHAASEAAYRDALRLLATTPPYLNQREVQRLHVVTLDGLGQLLHELHRDPESVQAHRQASEIIGSLCRHWPKDAEIQRLATRDIHLALAFPETANKELTLRRVIATLTQLKTQFADDEELMIALAQAQDHLGEMLRTTGQHREAESILRQAMDTFQTVIASQPLFRLAQFQQASCQIHLASLLSETSRIAEAETVSRAAVEGLGRLLTTSPQYVPYRKDLARAHAQRGRLLHELNQLEAASSEYQRSIDLYTALQGQTDDSPSLQAGLATCLSHLGRAMLQQQNREASRTHYDRSCTLWSDLVQRYPEDPDYRRSLASARVNLTRFTNYDETVRLCELAIVEMDQLSARYPERVVYAQDLIRFHSLCGHALQQIDRLTDAEAHYSKAIEIAAQFQLENPEVQRDDESLGEFITFGDVSSQLGKFRQAAEAHRTAVERCRKLLEQSAGKEIYRSNLCSALKRLAIDEIGLGQIGEALGHAQESLQVAEQLVSDFPDQPQYAAKLDRRHTLLARIHIFREELPMAMNTLERQKNFAESFRRSFPQFRGAVTSPAILQALKVALSVESDPSSWSDMEVETKKLVERLGTDGAEMDACELQLFWAELLAATGHFEEAAAAAELSRLAVARCDAPGTMLSPRLLVCQIRLLVLDEWITSLPPDSSEMIKLWQSFETRSNEKRVRADREWYERCMNVWMDLRNPSMALQTAIEQSLEADRSAFVMSEWERNRRRMAWAYRTGNLDAAKQSARAVHDGRKSQDVESMLLETFLLADASVSAAQDLPRHIRLAHPLEIARLWRLRDELAGSARSAKP